VSVNSFDEWSPLREAVVGSAIHYTANDLDLSFKLFFHDEAYSSFYYPSYSVSNRAAAATPTARILKQRYVEELAEDIEEFVVALEGLSVKVLRPLQLTRMIRFHTPYWSGVCLPALNIRDQVIVLGDEIIETPPQVRARYFENDLLKPIFYTYFNAGAKWTTMPRPMMTDRSFDTSYVSGQRTPALQEIANPQESEFDVGFEMMFDAAQCIRFGRDVLVNVATENHALAVRWLRRHLEGQFRFHVLKRFADNHIDSLVLPLRPGVLLLRNPEIGDKLPEPLRKWDKIYSPEPTENIFPTYEEDDIVITSKYIDMNVLSVDENTVIANTLFPELIKELERHGFTVVPVRHRHRRLFGGGFHCFTLDTVRAGSTAEDYLC
jgi:glycine amidinotransferase